MSKRLAAHFGGYFALPWDGRYEFDYHKRSKEQESAREDFIRITNFAIIWTQVHGDFKNPVKRAAFAPYPHWHELHEACKLAVQETIAAEPTREWLENLTASNLMNTAMHILKAKWDLKAPIWWLPIIKQLREAKPTGGWRPGI